MRKKYVVRLTAKERRILREVVSKLAGSSQKVRRAQMLLKADEAGPAWTDERIAEAFDSRTRTVEKLRERFVTHTIGAFYEAFPPARARALVRRLHFCHTPKHGSWPNIAEDELSSLTRQCVSGRRFSTLPKLRSELSAWSTDANTRQRGVDWQMKVKDARGKLKFLYPKIKT
jgi:hypothetical protein